MLYVGFLFCFALVIYCIVYCVLLPVLRGKKIFGKTEEDELLDDLDSAKSKKKLAKLKLLVAEEEADSEIEEKYVDKQIALINDSLNDSEE